MTWTLHVRRFVEMAVGRWRGHSALRAMVIQDQSQGIENGQGEAQPGGRGIVRDKSGKVKDIGGCVHQAVISAPNLCEWGNHGKVWVLKYLGR